MKNLACDKSCDAVILNELLKARINVEKAQEHNSEVPYSIIGKLGSVTFSRAWYYYVVKCKIPIKIAKEIYKDQACNQDVRAAGDCGCLPPEKRSTKIAVKSGKKVVSQKEFDLYKSSFEDNSWLVEKFIG